MTSHRENRNGLKSGRSSESFDAQDFEMVGQQNLQSIAQKGETIDEEKDSKDPRRGNNEPQHLVDKIKSEIRPFKRELIDDQRELHRLKSNLIEDSKNKPPTNENNNEMKKSQNNNPNEKPDNNVDAHDLQYELHSLKYQLIKKNDQLDKLKNKIKNINNIMKNVTEQPDNEKWKIQMELLKKELKDIQDIPDDNDYDESTTPDVNKKPFQIKLFDKFAGPLFLEVFLGSSFHVINAVLVVILLSIYYSREPFEEKQYIATLTVLSYFITTIVYGYVTSKILLNRTTFQGNNWTKELIKHVILFFGCLTTCVILVYFVALRYEDATTFIMNMIYLMFCCLAVNLPLTYLSTKLTDYNQQNHRQPSKSAHSKPPTSLKKSE